MHIQGVRVTKYNTRPLEVDKCYINLCEWDLLSDQVVVDVILLQAEVMRLNDERWKEDIGIGLFVIIIVLLILGFLI